MYCPTCGNEITVELKYCNRCGANLAFPQTSLPGPVTVPVSLTAPTIVIGLTIIFGLGIIFGGVTKLAEITLFSGNHLDNPLSMRLSSVVAS